jgi:hypothetical protein
MVLPIVAPTAPPPRNHDFKILHYTRKLLCKFDWLIRSHQIFNDFSETHVKIVSLPIHWDHDFNKFDFTPCQENFM